MQSAKCSVANMKHHDTDGTSVEADTAGQQPCHSWVETVPTCEHTSVPPQEPVRCLNERLPVMKGTKLDSIHSVTCISVTLHT